MNTISTTASERVEILRFRSGLTQVQYSKKIGVPYRRLVSWERGASEPDPKFDDPVVDKLLTLGETARVLRRRLGLDIREAGKLIGISHVTVIALERGKSKLAEAMVSALLERVNRERESSEV